MNKEIEKNTSEYKRGYDAGFVAAAKTYEKGFADAMKLVTETIKEVNYHGKSKENKETDRQS